MTQLNEAAALSIAEQLWKPGHAPTPRAVAKLLLAVTGAYDQPSDSVLGRVRSAAFACDPCCQGAGEAETCPYRIGHYQARTLRVTFPEAFTTWSTTVSTKLSCDRCGEETATTFTLYADPEGGRALIGRATGWSTFKRDLCPKCTQLALEAIR